MKRIVLIILLGCLLVSIYNTFIFAQAENEDLFNQNIDFEQGTLKAEVLEVETEGFKEGRIKYSQDLQIEIFSEPYSGEIREIENNIMRNSIYGENLLEEGDRILLAAFYENGELVDVQFQDLLRERGLIYLGALTLVLLLIIAKRQGVRTITALLLTMGIIFFYLIPQIAEGAAPIQTAVLTSLVLIVIIQGIIGGFRIKSLAAIIGTAAGVICAGVLAYVFGQLVELSGLSSEEARLLLGSELNFDPEGILFAGIIIGSLGAVTDVAMSIASVAETTWKNSKKLSISRLYKIGLQVGRDIIGTMSNTLILAYAGSSLSLFILFYHFSEGWVELINMDLVATEIIRGLAGTVGLIITIPITAFSAAVLYNKLDSE
ncbi:putative membrane protein [Halanaerobium saccharolyticum]|uniref:Putative membrane protein n=1 Tax=Halanaerobium saccharolyticum TaxID=43595 RepID=A0A4V3G672_9FIRM|nr:YibE/F family protein [Halanaerobium saccharolyticum]RAK11868.1 putative membrane protein [Halanaerobium saccharolyticum]TDW07709.1 putative membrane protein [Halanaerobium saccharolyticum]TDX64630.1 putative membrane protein [Halanaerobium saccharolyticum]